MGDDAKIKQADGVSPKIADARYLLFFFGVDENFANKPQIFESQFLRFKAQRAEGRSRLQRPAKDSPDKILVRLNVFKLPMDDGE